MLAELRYAGRNASNGQPITHAIKNHNPNISETENILVHEQSRTLELTWGETVAKPAKV